MGDMFVFPAYAGMFRPEKENPVRSGGFPRICGDVPFFSKRYGIAQMFSPHTRGCSADYITVLANHGVFPAYAGMFRRFAPAWRIRTCFPRIRGDVPVSFTCFSPLNKFSPHTRGCSEDYSEIIAFDKVFPAYAGMFRPRALSILPGYRFPRIRGDVPMRPASLSRRLSFSPHTRGCSYRRWGFPQTPQVFPAYAGMFRSLSITLMALSSFPRIRGDVPG